jgi:lipoyl(octanoyl) transferase
VALSGKSAALLPFKSLRVIPYHEYTGVQNMALDLMFSDQVEKTSVPILRFYGWKPYCLSLGYHQKSDDIDLDRLKKSGYDIVRRPTGGSAIFHSEELTYSFIIPKNNLSHHSLYEIFHSALGKALNQLGYNVTLSSQGNPDSYLNQGNNTFACFNRAAKSELKYEKKKLVGSAQKLFSSTILQHGSIMIGKKHEEIVSFLKADIEEKNRQKMYLKEHAITLSEIREGKISIFSITDRLLENLSALLLVNNIFYKYTENDELKLSEAFYDKVIVTAYN